jgi:hypothetical protein
MGVLIPGRSVMKLRDVYALERSHGESRWNALGMTVHVAARRARRRWSR